MNKLNPRNKICFQTFNRPSFLKIKKIKKYKKRKWFFIKKKLIYKKKKIEKPEKRKIFFKKRLIEQQTFRTFYGCIANYKVKKLKNNTITLTNFIKKIESHLDINILRFKKVKSIFYVKQLINHNKIKVNNKIVNRSNFLLKPGDKIIILKNKVKCF